MLPDYLRHVVPQKGGCEQLQRDFAEFVVLGLSHMETKDEIQKFAAEQALLFLTVVVASHLKAASACLTLAHFNLIDFSFEDY